MVPLLPARIFRKIQLFMLPENPPGAKQFGGADVLRG
jgi:hypothetical protein